MIRVRQIQKELDLSKAELNEILISFGEDVQKYNSNYRIENDIAEKIREKAINKKLIKNRLTTEAHSQSVSNTKKSINEDSIIPKSSKAQIKKANTEGFYKSESKSNKKNKKSKEKKIKVRSYSFKWFFGEDGTIKRNMHDNSYNTKKTKVRFSARKIMKFRSLFITSNKSIGDVLNKSSNMDLLSKFLIIDKTWNKDTLITEQMLSVYKSDLISIITEMEKKEQPLKYQSKYKDYRNYWRIILGGRGG